MLSVIRRVRGVHAVAVVVGAMGLASSSALATLPDFPEITLPFDVDSMVLSIAAVAILVFFAGAAFVTAWRLAKAVWRWVSGAANPR